VIILGNAILRRLASTRKWTSSGFGKWPALIWEGSCDPCESL
jgi:hypothetical protein